MSDGCLLAVLNLMCGRDKRKKKKKSEIRQTGGFKCLKASSHLRGGASLVRSLGPANPKGTWCRSLQ